MASTPYDDLVAALRRFRDTRELGATHRPKDLALAVAAEAGELLQHFLWRDGDALSEHLVVARQEILDEAADVAIYVTYLCDALGADLLAVMESKLRVNEERYPPADGTAGRH